MVKPDNSQETLLAMAVSRLGHGDFSNHLHAWLQACLAYDNITILAYFQNQPPVLVMFKNRHPKVHENINHVYLAGAYLLDPFHELHIKNVPEGVYRLSDIAPDKFNRNQYFREYYANTTMVDEFAFVSYPTSGISLHVCLGRDGHSNKRFTTRDLAVARRVLPLVTSLAANHWKDLASDGEFTKDEIAANLIKAVHRAHDISLSPRQAEVALLVLQGHSSVSIGLELGISYQTVKVFRKQLYRKCKISSQAELFNLMLPMLVSLTERRNN
jgi:DNA-binding CsgD family transcriptional regulator